MKGLLIASMMIMVYSFGNAQTLTSVISLTSNPSYLSPVVLQSGQRVAYKISRPPGLRLRNVGTILTVAGGAMIIGGIIVYNNREEYPNVYSSGGQIYVDDVSDEEVIGQAMVGAGIGMVIPGIICWTKGGKTYKRHLERETSLNILPGKLSISYRF